MYNLFLDDTRHPQSTTWVKLPESGTWIIARNYNEFVECVEKNGLPTFVAFDHDLADADFGKDPSKDTFKEKTGMDCAKWLVEYCMDNNKPFPEYVIQSMNPIGAINIRAYIENFKNTIK